MAELLRLRYGIAQSKAQLHMLAVVVVAVGLFAAPCQAQVGTTAARDSARDQWLKSATTITTKHYILTTDLPAEFHHTVQRHLDCYFHAVNEIFSHLDVSSIASLDRCHFWFFFHHSSYRACFDLPRGVLGHFSPETEIAHAYLPRPFFQKTGVAEFQRALETVLHECTHQIMYRKCGKPMLQDDQVPRWLNEGLAEFVEKGVRTPDGLFTGTVTYTDLLTVRRALGEQLLLPPSILMRSQTEYWHRHQASHDLYTQAWLLIHFFIYAEQGRYRHWFGNLIKSAVNGTPWKQVLANQVTPADLQQLDHAYWRFVSTLRRNDMEKAILKAVFLAHGIHMLGAERQLSITNGTSLSEIQWHLNRFDYYYDFGIDYGFRQIRASDRDCLAISPGANLYFRRLVGGSMSRAAAFSPHPSWHDAVVWTQGLEPRDIQVRWNRREQRWQVQAD